MSKNQTSGLWMRFTKQIDIKRFIDIGVNFDIMYEGHQNWSKILSMDILSIFGHIVCDVKIDINMCEPHCVN